MGIPVFWDLNSMTEMTAVLCCVCWVPRAPNWPRELCALSPLIPFTVNTTPQIQSTTISHCSHCVLPTISRLSILSWSLESRLLLKLTSFWIEPLSTPILLMSFFSIKPRNLFSQSNVGLCSLMRPLWVQPHGHDLQFHSSFFLSQSFHFFKIIF